MNDAGTPPWEEVTEEYTRRLVAISSVSPGPGEIEAAKEALAIMREDGLEHEYQESGLEALIGDPHGRSIAYALVRGSTPRTFVVLGHLDTVGTSDYRTLEAHALSPDDLESRFDELSLLAPDVVGFEPKDWMYGRGAADMKSGVAAMLAVTRHLARRNRAAPLPFSVVCIATVDEENESAGVIQAVRLLTELRDRHRLDFVGAINTDYVSERFAGDTARPVYAGTVGKLLPSFLAIGAPGHAGAPFDGLDANLVLAELVRDISLDPGLADIAEGVAPGPPVTLRAGDLKARYDTQLALSAQLAVNLVTVSVTPGVVLEQLRQVATLSLRRVESRVLAAEFAWRKRAGLGPRRRPAAQGDAHTYSEVARKVEEAHGREALESALEEARAGFTDSMDSRRRCLALVEAAWRMSGLPSPAVVVYFAPPYYPHLAPRPSPLLDALRTVVAAHPELDLVYEPYFPLLSDLSYLGHQAGAGIEDLVANMPIWPLGYSLPLDGTRALDMPVINIGPYGFGVHQAGERVHRAYSFGAVPQLILETMERAAS